MISILFLIFLLLVYLHHTPGASRILLNVKEKNAGINMPVNGIHSDLWSESEVFDPGDILSTSQTSLGLCAPLPLFPLTQLAGSFLLHRSAFVTGWASGKGNIVSFICKDLCSRKGLK